MSFFNLGHVFHDQKRLDKAIEAYERAIEIDPKYKEAYNKIAQVFVDQKRPDRAISALQKGTEINPKWANGYFNLGVVLQRHNRPEEAIVAYKKAIETKPPLEGMVRLTALQVLTQLYKAQGDSAEAARWAKELATAKAAEKSPNPSGLTLLDKKESLTENDPAWKPANPKCDPLLKLVSGNPHKVYTLALMKGDKLVIRLKSRDMKIDPFVALEDSKKHIIDYDDDEDFPNVRNSKLVVIIPDDGEYRIIATCTHEQIMNKFGEFHLTVEKTK